VRDEISLGKPGGVGEPGVAQGEDHVVAIWLPGRCVRGRENEFEQAGGGVGLEVRGVKARYERGGHRSGRARAMARKAGQAGAHVAKTGH